MYTSIENAEGYLLREYARYVEAEIDQNEIPLGFEQWQENYAAPKDESVPYGQNIYLIIRLKLQSKEEITEDVWQEVVENCDYNFTSKTLGVIIESTEIKEVQENMIF